MVKIKGFKAYRPINPEEFTTLPYDVIDKKMEEELKKNPNSIVHVILPNGNELEKYKNAKKVLNDFIQKKLLYQEQQDCIFLYRQESLNNDLIQEGFIFLVSIDDYITGNIKKHEDTREKPLIDRLNLIKEIKMNTGLVWTVYEPKKQVSKLILEIKQQAPEVSFEKYNYRHILWKSNDTNLINQLQHYFKSIKLYIADGHHRAASAVEYGRLRRNELNGKFTGNEDFNYFMVYAQNEIFAHIFPYNRVIKKLPLNKNEFISKVGEFFNIEQLEDKFIPQKKGEIGIYLDSKWYCLTLKTKYKNESKNLFDSEILQKYIFEPILKIEDIRKSENIIFVGGIVSVNEMEKYIDELGNDIFFSLHPVNISDIKRICNLNRTMPPKTTWFEPKLLTGLVLNPILD